MKEAHQQQDISTVVEDVEGMQNYDGDDVAYRLRLLVKNNYFLPPAHMKPSPEDFAASTNAKKSPTPTFLDIFRVGKSKSRPALVTSTFGPILRTTSDTIASPCILRNHQRVPHSPHNAAFPSNGTLDRGRVAVVKERVTDIAVAAKQAEQETKTRNARRDFEKGRQRLQTLVKRQVQYVDDVIDPTDAVDIPLPASNYPFAVQASALHGLGVQESVGAAILADRLPPNSPGMSSIGETDDHWRKVLLQQAVHHSLDNTPDESMFSYVPGTSNPVLATPRVNGELSRSTTPGTRAKRLQQHIVEPQISFEVEESSMEAQAEKKGSVRKSVQSQTSTSRSTYKSFLAPDSNDSRRSSFLPARAITPLETLTPLTPAPRNREPFSATYSHSHSDLQHQSSDTPLSSPKSKLRRSMSTPLFTEFELMRQQFVMTPPPPPVSGTRRFSQMTQLTVQTHSYETTAELPSAASAFSSQSTFDDSDGRVVRGSPRLSALGNRSSFLSFSQGSMSPTTSAFQEVLNHAGEQSSISSLRYSSVDESTEPDTHTRSSLASPYPRPSTSSGHDALQPPPRSSSFNYSISSLNRSAASSEPRIEISAASPTKGEWRTSPYASSSRHDVRPIPSSLELLTTSTEVAIHSPAPSSPTSFFDTLQTQPNAMDDLDSSDDSEGDASPNNVAQSPPPPSILSVHSSPPTFLVDARTRTNSTVSISPIKPSTMMRLGNFSAPYIGRGHFERPRMLPIGLVDSRKALGFTPTRSQFFSERKGDLGYGGELSTTLFAQAQSQAQNKNVDPLMESPVISRGPSSSSNILMSLSNIGRRRPAAVSRTTPVSPTSPLRQEFTAQRPEALRRLDGMLVQHIEEEKDRIKKIAGAIKSSSQVNLSSVNPPKGDESIS